MSIFWLKHNANKIPENKLGLFACNDYRKLFEFLVKVG